MVLGIASHQIKNYAVETPVFSGPLDLLLFLIERSELDITTLSLATVTDQYIEHFKDISDQLSEEVSAFLIIATKLLQIKSEALLPRSKTSSNEENLGDELANQLILYQRFKRAASVLAALEESGYHTYLRLAESPKTDQHNSFDGVDLFLLRFLANSKTHFDNETVKIDHYLSSPRISIREKIKLIVTRLETIETILYSQLLPRNPQVIEVVVTFLAMLELIKQRWIIVFQENIFADIQIQKTELYNSEYLFALEFEE